MKKRFNGDRGMVKCGSDTMYSPDEKKKLLKRNIKSNKAKVKKLMSYMDNLKDMHMDYDFNHQAITDLVGNVYIQLDSAKGEIDSSKLELKKI